ncbi:hypothetical protein [Acinetobacter sp.]|uniref:hypothetical protein n=1 Tax=Acinetobacter sp. TaxID=472 RepID=UPI00388E21E8
MNAMANFGGEKFMNRLFRRAPGVVWDMMTGKVGFKTGEGIATFTGQGDDAQIEINMFDQFGMEVPAFAQSTPIDAVNVGDLIYFGSGEKAGWIVEKRYGVKPVGSSTPAKRPSRKSTAAGPAADPLDLTVAESDLDKSNVQFTLMKVDGQRTTWKPPKVSMLGMGADGVMVIRSLLTMLPGGQNDLNGMQSNMMMMMQMSAMSGNEDGPDMEKLMPIMLMSSMGGNNAGGMNPMLMMMMMGGNNPMANLFGGGNKTGGNSGGKGGPFRT